MGYYRAQIQTHVEEFIESNRDTLWAQIAGLAMSEFTSVHDIRDFIDEHISPRLKERIVTEAKETAEQLVDLYQRFCGEDCMDQMADFLKALFKAMHQGECTDAREFCGACQNNANDFLGSEENSIPCCFNKL